MRVGVQMIFQSWGYDKSVTDAEVVADEIRLGVLADELGFHALWPVEHHFNDYSFCPDNTVFLANMAARTKQILLGTGAVILPWNDPLRVAENALHGRLVDAHAGLLSRGGGDRLDRRLGQLLPGALAEIRIVGAADVGFGMVHPRHARDDIDDARRHFEQARAQYEASSLTHLVERLQTGD